jgi:glycosyltransferase involved in cell wall biosynthesis
MIDVLIQTFNEELNLPHTLASLRGWDSQVFVVDSGSTDRTRQIAQEWGAHVVEHPWEGYARQKNWALDCLPLQRPWTLILDADEALSPELRAEIEQIARRPLAEVRHSAYHINRVLVFMGRPIRHCGYFPSWNLRLFKRGHARYEDRSVHEHMEVYGPTGHLHGLIMHEDRRGLEHFFAKHNRYSTLEAQEIFEHPELWPGLARFLEDRVLQRKYIKTRVLPLLPLPWLWRLVYMYVFQFGFLDGRAGWTLCNFVSTYEFLIHAKYQDLRRGGTLRRGGQGLSVPEGLVDPAARARASTPYPARPPSLASVAQSAAPGNPSVPRRMPRHDGPKVPVSVIVPTLNEARNLPSCLDHLAWADEVVVVDSGSTDGTQEIARQYSATVLDFHWDGRWPKKKNWALRNADLRHDWVLIVDADEWITAEQAAEIGQAITADHYVGYYVNRRFIFMGQWIRHCGYYPSWNLRLIRRGCGEYEQLTGVGDTGSGDNEVHEHVVATGPVGYLKHDMLHFAFPSIHTFVEKHNRYSNWEAMVQLRGQSSAGSAVVTDNPELSRRRRLRNLSRRLPFRPMLRFLYSYIWQGGFLDGRPGYIFCRLLAMYEYLSVAKYYEMTRQGPAAVVTSPAPRASDSSLGAAV